MKVLNLDNAESREVVESCFRTRKVLINPIVDWSDDDVWQYIKQEGLKLNPLYSCGQKRIGCIGCPLAGKSRYEELTRYPKYKDMYIRAFQKMVDKRIQDGMPTYEWRTGKDVFHWWMEDGVMPGQLELEGYEI